MRQIASITFILVLTASISFWLGVQWGKGDRRAPAEEGSEGNVPSRTNAASDSPVAGESTHRVDSDGEMHAGRGIRDLLGEPSFEGRIVRMEALLQGMTPGDIGVTVHELIGQPSSRYRDHPMEVALKHWGKVEPEAAVAFAEGRFGMDRTYFLNWVVAGWVSAAPAGAKDWLTGHKDFPYLDVHGSIVLNAVGRMAEFDPHVAWVFWSDLPGTLKQGNFWRIIRPTVGTEVFTDVVAEIMDLPLGSGRKQALHNTARATGQYAWDAGLAILERLDAGEQKRFAETMVTGASHESISEALRLVDRLPQNTQEAAYEAALKRLATQGNPNDFATWLNEQSPDPALDGPISEFALHLNGNYTLN